MIKIVYACNDKMFDGLYLSILSIVRRTKEPINFYLLTGNFVDINPNYTELSTDHSKIISSMVKRFNSKNSFTVINCRDKYLELLSDNVNKSRCTIYADFRLLLDSYKCFSGKVLYLDTDTMAVNNIKEFNKVKLDQNEFAVAHNPPSIRWYQKKNYFNSGVVLFNMDVCHKSQLFTKARELLKNKHFVSPDQTALYLAATKFMFFPNDEYRFNRQDNHIKKSDIIKHFVGQIFALPNRNNIKQWQIDKVHKYLKFKQFDKDYEIYNKMLEDQKSNLRNERFINISHLRKSYGDLKAVDDISFRVKKGSLFAFLGINGAGKSTTINIISSTLNKDSGDITINALDLIKDNERVKRLIGIVFQNSALDGLLTVKENLVSRAKFYNMKKPDINLAIKHVSEMLNLGPIINQQVSKLSGGQRRRVDIARALIHEPKLLILDEPTTGLDPKTRLDVWKLIDEVRERTGMTVFLTTHYLEEADKATYVVIMNKGKIIAEGTPNELKDKYSTDILTSYQKRNTAFESKLSDRKFSYDEDAKAYRIVVKDGKDVKNLLKKLDRSIVDFELKKGDMDSVFLNVTGGDVK